MLYHIQCESKTQLTAYNAKNKGKHNYQLDMSQVQPINFGKLPGHLPVGQGSKDV